MPNGAELWLNPEIDQGFGLSNTVGMAGFPSGEAYKVGSNAPYLRLPRAFIRHSIGLGGAQENIDPAPNQLGGSRAQDNLTLNRSLAAGLVIKGERWGRPADSLGIAAVANRLSAAARDYFSHGGIGILIGDGGLNYGAEKIAEAYYSNRLTRQISLSLDLQYARNQAYNRSREPVHIYALRTHGEF